MLFFFLVSIIFGLHLSLKTGLPSSAELLNAESPLWSFQLYPFSWDSGPSSSLCAFSLAITLLRKGVVKEFIP